MNEKELLETLELLDGNPLIEEGVFYLMWEQKDMKGINLQCLRSTDFDRGILLNGCKNLTLQHFGDFDFGQKLIYFSEFDMDLSGGLLAGLTGASSLQKLALRRGHYQKSDILDLNFGDKPKLKKLRLGFHNLSSESIALISQASGLVELKLDGNPLDDSSVDHITKLSSLETLTLCGTKLTSKGINKLEVLDRLRFLDLGETRLDRSAAECLARLPNLNDLYLYNVKMDEKKLDALLESNSLKTLHLSAESCTKGALEIIARNINGRTRIWT